MRGAPRRMRPNAVTRAAEPRFVRHRAVVGDTGTAGHGQQSTVARAAPQEREELRRGHGRRRRVAGEGGQAGGRSWHAAVPASVKLVPGTGRKAQS